MPKQPSVYLISLGCPKNRVDSEIILGGLYEQGFGVTKNAEEADVLVVNTCAFIGPAKEESIEAILEMAALKEKHKDKKLIVAGCLAQRYGSDLASEMPEVDHFVGTTAISKMDQLVALGGLVQAEDSLSRVLIFDPNRPYYENGPRLRTTSGGYAYLKISEGCLNSCSFCVIPSIRGRQRSRRIEDIVQEAGRLASTGAKEINLIAQDLTAYGLDREGRPALADLLESLSLVEGIRWIRLLYAYPRRFPDRLLEIWSSNPKVLPYLDIPLQHASPSLLASMNRPKDLGLIKKDLNRLRDVVGQARGGFAFRTTFLVGHPGESEKDFQVLMEFVEEMRFEHMGVFVYSDEEGTAAFDMPDKVPAELALERRDRLMELQQGISAEHQGALIGRTLEVLVEGRSEESELVIQGRHRAQAPDVDGVVYIEGGLPNPGEIVEVEISSAYDYDLVGTVLPSKR